MNSNIKIQIAASVTAVICAAGIIGGASSAVRKITRSNLTIAEKLTSDKADDFFDFGDDLFAEDPVADDTAAAADTAQADAAVSDSAPAGADTADTQADTAASPSADKSSDGGSSSAAPAQKSSEKSSVPSTKAEIIEYCNNVLNTTKAAKPGFTKKYVMDPKGPSEGVVKNVVGIVTKDETKTIKKGSDITDEFPAAEHSWSSKLREQDVASASLKQRGQYYEILIRLGEETNPAKGEASSYGRVMSVIDTQGAASRLPGIKNVNMVYHDGYVHAVVDSKSGRIVKVEFSATADVSATIPVFGDVAINNIVSTETFTDFVY